MGWQPDKDVKLHLRQLFLLWRGMSDASTHEWYMRDGLRMGCRMKHGVDAHSATRVESLMRPKYAASTTGGKERFLKCLTRTRDTRDSRDVPMAAAATPEVTNITM